MTDNPNLRWTLDGRGGGRPRTSDGSDHVELVWEHVDYGDDAQRAWLEESSDLPPVVVAALLADEPRPRSLVQQGGLLLVLRGVNKNEGADPEDMVSLRLWLQRDRIVSVRRRRFASIGDIREQLEAGDGPRNTGEFLQELIDRVLDRIGETVGAVDDLADELEDGVVELEGRELRPRLGALRRQAIALRRYIAPQRDVLGRLHAEKLEWLDDSHRARLREAADRITRYVEDLDAARDRAAVTQEELANRLNEQMNRTMYILSIITAIFLPLGLLTGLLGINVGGLPGTESPHAFTIVTVGLIAMAVGLAAWFRSRQLF